MDPTQTAALTESDLDRLEELLDADNFNGDTLQLDELQGFVCAVASGPEDIAPEAWIPAVLGGEPQYASEEQRREIEDLLVRFFGDMATVLADGEVPDLILYPGDDESDAEGYDFAAWADGYLYGTQVGETSWLDAAGEHGEFLSELMEDFFILNGALKDDALQSGEPWVSPAEEARLIAQAQEGLHDRILAIYDFWGTLTPVATHRRESPKVGRNDPCPCGSGKKYKQCCGDPKKLH